jgi:hypothetical protein
MQKFQQEELMQFLYKETSTELTLAIESALQNDWQLQDELKMLERTMLQLDKIQLVSPRQSSINAILAYAKATDEVAHHS